jgi:hypothetical protein
MEDLPNLYLLAAALLSCSLIGSGISEVTKTLLEAYAKRLGIEEPWYMGGLSRAVPVLLGTLIGVAWSTVIPLPWGPIMGACGGVLSAIIYKRVKSLVETVKIPYLKS